VPLVSRRHSDSTSPRARGSRWSSSCGCYYRRTPTLSACLIVRNEALVLDRCLSSLSEVVDEIVVVDTGSTDATPQIAERFGARLCRFEWCGDFSAARNVALDAASCDWILSIDADECLAPESTTHIRAVITETDAEGILVTVRNLLPADDLLQSAESQIVRLFRRRDDVRFAGLIHEEVTAAITRRGGRIASSPVVIVHDGYSRETAQASGSRAERNLPLLIRAVDEAPRDPYLHFHLGATYQHLGRHADAARHLTQVLELPKGQLNLEILANAAVRLAQLAMAERRDDSVVNFAGQALAHDPNHVLAHYLSGLALMRQGRLAEAYSHLAAVKSSGKAGLSTASDLDALIAYCASQQ
jgi:tetratricopeptide (TPR) repeat protein